MSKRAWIVLIGLFILSLLVTGLVTWTFTKYPRFPGPPPAGPTHPLPWYRWRWHRLVPRAPVPERHERPRFLFPWGERRIFTYPHFLWKIGRVLASEIFFLLIGSLALLLFPTRIKRSAHVLRPGHGGNPWAALGIGVVSTLFFLLLGILATFSVAGIFFMPWLLLLFGFAWATGWVIMTLEVGYLVRRLFHISDAHRFVDLLFGVLVLVTVGVVPVAGWIVLVLANMWGVGAVVLTRFGATRGWQPGTLWQEEE